MLKYSLYEPEKPGIVVKYPLNVSKRGPAYTFDYPCVNSSNCTDYVIDLPKGLYKFELYGASGGSATGKVSTFHYENGVCLSQDFVDHFNGNTKCLDSFDAGGAGGYVSGIVSIRKPIQIYATIGGMGSYFTSSCMRQIECFQPGTMVPGGYGGGGSSSAFPSGTASGGGATSVKFLKNTLFHRVIVSGAGGGSDDTGGNDGRGGSGGGLVAQGWWDNRNYVRNYIANSSFGFTFGSGEAAQFQISMHPNGVKQQSSIDDKCGAGAGWFGGFASNQYNSGCGGGSSWVLTKDAVIPDILIHYHDEFYNELGSDTYKFDNNSEYLFTDVHHVPGIWQGNGRLVITTLTFSDIPSCFERYQTSFSILFYILFCTNK
ncbi:hypothetical protein TVAG_347830 [Trichomonas vaginalis G3]|uniref:receptor protein-tyrosine kinase n=1 Tax=Trichomonas vaginalis (strain ATCC PRA-98 / G3) TaxID=412133 RepID=A2DSS4_TRIV3|nr:glycine-rich protein family [Trichomonas vaginalis G3]EAY16473.1 hypothetical protein TVAG_347830 [Trichomonas vaginalis G3]KAI5493601.1 glycine-rich protein family [Trichomonas vaginalis G3]|eukprot:XP_001328696.1 hypothetical protein [Trichomonas vaginalis G3]